MRRALVLLVFSAILPAGCGGKTATTPTPTVLTTYTDFFTGTLSIGGTQPYTFSVPQGGTATATLIGLQAADGTPVSKSVSLGLGILSGTDCNATTKQTVKPALQAQVTTTVSTGSYCAAIADVGDLTGDVKFFIRIVQNAPSTTATSSTTETYTGNVAARGSTSRTFVANANGTVTLTLQSLNPTADMGLGIGVPGIGTNLCTITTMVTATPGATAHLAATVDAANYCLTLIDLGNLPATTPTASFVISILHP